MKLVVDTNTIISGSLWQGPPARLVSAALGGQAQMFISLPMLLELRETLQRPKFAERIAARGETPDTLAAKFRAACHEAVPGASCRPLGCATPTTCMFSRVLWPWRLTRLSRATRTC